MIARLLPGTLIVGQGLVMWALTVPRSSESWGWRRHTAWAGLVAAGAALVSTAGEQVARAL